MPSGGAAVFVLMANLLMAKKTTGGVFDGSMPGEGWYFSTLTINLPSVRLGRLLQVEGAAFFK